MADGATFKMWKTRGNAWHMHAKHPVTGGWIRESGLYSEVAAMIAGDRACDALQEPLRYKRKEDCPARAKHTPEPTDYCEWFEWADKKAKTHTQHRCPTCGFWAIWKREPASTTDDPQGSSPGSGVDGV